MWDVKSDQDERASFLALACASWGAASQWQRSVTPLLPCSVHLSSSTERHERLLCLAARETQHRPCTQLGRSGKFRVVISAFSISFDTRIKCFGLKYCYVRPHVNVKYFYVFSKTSSWCSAQRVLASARALVGFEGVFLKKTWIDSSVDATLWHGWWKLSSPPSIFKPSAGDMTSI